MPSNNLPCLVSLTAENIMRLKAVRIDFDKDESLFIVGGENEQGKSAVLNCIAMALGGKSYVPPKPVREGTEKGHVVLDLDKLIVEMEVKPDRSRELVVKGKDGGVFRNGQEILNKLYGERKIFFDARKFLRMNDAELQDLLAKIVGIDLADIKARRGAAFDRRTDLNRDAKRLQATIAELPEEKDVPEEKVVVSELLETLRKRQKHNASIDALGDDLAVKEEAADNYISEVESIGEHIDQLKNKLAELTDQRKREQENVCRAEEESKAFREKIKKSERANTDEVHDQISSAEEVNAKIDRREQRLRKQEELADTQAKITMEEVAIRNADTEKINAITAAKLPVDGLAFGEEGITLDGFPFPEQASDEQEMIVSAVIGFALNPDLRILILPRGADLDRKHLEKLRAIAKDENFLVLTERPGTGEEMSVIIEDGEVCLPVEDGEASGEFALPTEGEDD